MDKEERISHIRVDGEVYDITNMRISECEVESKELHGALEEYKRNKEVKYKKYFKGEVIKADVVMAYLSKW